MEGRKEEGNAWGGGIIQQSLTVLSIYMICKVSFYLGQIVRYAGILALCYDTSNYIATDDTSILLVDDGITKERSKTQNVCVQYTITKGVVVEDN